MINWIKNLWISFFVMKPGVYESQLAMNPAPQKFKVADLITEKRPAYDPSEDPMRVMTGEYESYFD